jgi:hypothetical protein
VENLDSKELKSFREIDLSQFDFPLITIYFSPDDFPDKYVARLFDMDKPTPYYVWKWSLSMLEVEIPPHMVFMERQEEDAQSILGVYM